MNENIIPETGAAAPVVPNVDVKIYPVKAPDKLLAFASVNLGGVFAVNNLRIYDSAKGPFVTMPSSKGKDGQYHDICCPTTKEMRQALNEAVLGEYQRTVERSSVRGALQAAKKESASRPAPAPDVQRTADKGAR